MHNIFFEIDKNLTLGMSQRFNLWIEGGFLSNLFTFFRGYGLLPVFSGRAINLPDAAMLGFFITLIKEVTGAKSNSKAVTRLSPFVAKLELRNLRSYIFCSMIKSKGEPGDLITGGNDAFVKGTR